MIQSNIFIILKQETRENQEEAMLIIGHLGNYHVDLLEMQKQEQYIMRNMKLCY